MCGALSPSESSWRRRRRNRGIPPFRHATLLLLSLFILIPRSWAATIGEFTDVNGTLVRCTTTAAKGKPFTIEVKEEWAPVGSQRFLKLVESGYFTDVPFFRVVHGFLTQFGITPNRDLRKYWRKEGSIQDDPLHGQPFKRGQLSFAGGGHNTRDSQLFIAYADSNFLGKSPWEVPVGRVVEGMEVIDALYGEYGDIKPFGPGPDQGKIWEEANEYLKREFPLLDYFKGCEIVPLPKSKPPPSLVSVGPRLRGLGDAEQALEGRQGMTPFVTVAVVGTIITSLLCLYKITDKRADLKAHL